MDEFGLCCPIDPETHSFKLITLKYGLDPLQVRDAVRLAGLKCTKHNRFLIPVFRNGRPWLAATVMRDYIDRGLCPKCGEKGVLYPPAALVCSKHGVYAGF